MAQRARRFREIFLEKVESSPRVLITKKKGQPLIKFPLPKLIESFFFSLTIRITN